jgi:signal transduction histidine kinase
MLAEEHTKEQPSSTLVDMRQQLEALQDLTDQHKHTETALAERTHLLALSATVGTACAGNDSLRTIMQRCAEALVQHLDIAAACIWTLNAEEQVLNMQASAGRYVHLDNLQGSVPLGESVIGRIAQERQACVTDTILDDAHLPGKTWAKRTGITAFAGYPLVVEDRLMGVMAMFASQPFTSTTLKSLAWMASVIAMGIDRTCISDALARSIAKVVRMNKRLRRKNTGLDEFTYIASHDLQEPLRKLMTFSSLLRRDLGDGLPERADKDLDFIVDAASRMQMLIHNLLDLSRAGNTAMHRDQVPLDACVNCALKALEAHIRATQAVIVRDVLPTVWGDHAMLTQLYQNLLSNALKFYDEPPPMIRLTVEQQGEQVVFGVQDNGIGIKPEYHQQIFAPFKRLHGHGEYEGAGIGLAICHKTVERHEGRIWVESDAGRGAHFKFTLANGT